MDRFSIHPRIGIARLGNSKSSFYLGPQSTGGLPTECDADGNEIVVGGQPQPVTQFKLLAAHSACLARPSGPGWAAVGDGAASHDPLSATGIVRALESGIHAARAIQATLVRGDREALAGYDRRQDRAFDQYCDTRTAYYRMEARWPSAPFTRGPYFAGVALNGVRMRCPASTGIVTPVTFSARLELR
jgi:2-polyprenyl-6-methoxyphenol hydroxylase-like FAD-dependent oxidoreductase